MVEDALLVRMLREMDDHDLVQASRRGDRAAFAALVDRDYAWLERSCRRMLSDADLARDAAQEAVLRALLGLELLRDAERFGAWLVGIGLNVCRGWIGRAEREQSTLEVLETVDRLGDPSAGAIDPLQVVATGELAYRVRSAIGALPAGQRHAVALFYLAGLTHAEIAGDLGTRASAVKTRLQKARVSLRVSLLDTYKEYIAMTDKSDPDESTELIAMRVTELRRTAAAEPGTERHIVFLEGDGDCRLPIWIGQAEATALALVLEDVELPRPGVYQFAAALLSGAGAQLREIRITELTSSVFYAQAVLSDGTIVDARPSDAITLALVARAPIYVSTAVLAKTDESGAELSGLLSEAEAATDNARVIAEEVRARHAAATAALKALETTPKRESAER